MKYILDNENYHIFEIYEENKEKPRSYFIPYKSKKSLDKASLKERRYSSKKVMCLNGDWDFKFYRNPNDCPVSFDTEDIEFDTLDVPSCWQFRGVDIPWYLNTRYQFPYNPPEIPTLEPVGKVFSWAGADLGLRPRWQTPEEQYNYIGVYRKTFKVKDEDKNFILSFLGASNNITVYMNGEYVGYSEGSHNTAEFDVTGFITEGENELLIVMHRWCNGTYLECQDMFRNNGIFRDVLLFMLDDTDFYDIDVKPRKTGDTYSLTVNADLFSDTEVKLQLLDREGNEVTDKVAAVSYGKRVKYTFEDLSVEEWNAEKPVLYDLYLSTKTNVVKVSVGFKDVKIEGNKFYVNGRLVKFHGVNHHDTSAENGYTMYPDDIERDIRLCKEYNIDTVRTSHYPPDPLFLELCDEYGLYVIDETDLETHGTFHMNLPPSYNLISDDPAWEDHYVDRVSRMYERDKNHGCVVMWSLGNEAGGYYCTDAEFNYLKNKTDIPVHYESVIHTKRVAYDVGSQMYPPVSRLHEVGEGTCKVPELNDRPYFLCEYAHAMGVGPGDIESYWKEIYAYDNLCGGCVWEMVDHGVKGEKGNYLYGGDHGEWIHDSNFCVDGLFYPDRTPSTGAKIVRFTYRPIRVSYIGNNVFEVFNTTGFTDASEYEVTFTFSTGKEVKKVFDLKPLTSGSFKVDPEEGEDVKVPDLMGDIRCTVSVKEIATGRIVSTEQMVTEKKPVFEKKLHRADSFPEGFSINGGAPCIFRGKELMTGSDPYTILWRAATDNDVDLAGRDTMSPFYDQKENVVAVKKKDGKILVRTEVTNKRGKFLCSDLYEACREGILVTSRIHPVFTVPLVTDLPRFGKAFRLPTDFKDITYQGRTGETYADMKDQFPVDVVRASVSDMTEWNVRPQESGNRMDCAYAILSDGKTRIGFYAVSDTFELGVKPYSDKELLAMKHRCDEKNTGTYVTLSAFQMGIGTGSCGPKTDKKYRYFTDRDYEFKYLITIEG